MRYRSTAASPTRWRDGTAAPVWMRRRCMRIARHRMGPHGTPPPYADVAHHDGLPPAMCLLAAYLIDPEEYVYVYEHKRFEYAVAPYLNGTLITLMASSSP